jgi:hypothetical protein
MSVRSLLSKLLDNRVGDHLRIFLDRSPRLELRPSSFKKAASDLFPWRVTDEWDTRFDLVNVPSLLFPERDLIDRPVVVVFDKNGKEICRKKFVLKPLEYHPLVLRDLLGEHTGVGTFAIFHSIRDLPELAEKKMMITDRGYLAFKRKQDKFWSYVHGNLQALAKAEDSDDLETLGGRYKNDVVYRPQLPFGDCKAFDLTFTNPTAVPQQIRLRLYDAKRNLLDTLDGGIISPLGLQVFSVDNTDGKVAMVEGVGKIAMWRPAIFKHYESHFAMLHS